MGVTRVAYFGSKATSGLCQPLIAMMPPHDTYIETHLGGGAIMRRKPAALRNIGIDRDARALGEFECDYRVELIHGCAHRFLGEYAFEGSELLYSDPPYWVHPATVCNLAMPWVIATTAMTSVTTAQAMIIIATMCAWVSAARALHRYAWESAGAAWTEERWLDNTGRKVRILYLTSTWVGEENRYRPGILAARSDGHRIEVFTTWMHQHGDWRELRFATPNGERVNVHYGEQCEIKAEGWRGNMQYTSVHAPEPDTVLLALSRTDVFALKAHVADPGQHTKSQKTMYLRCHTPGRRHRLRRFMHRETARCMKHHEMPKHTENE